MIKFYKSSLLVALLLTILAVINVFPATITSTQSGAWNASETWGGTLPTANDDVIINGDFIVTVTSSDAVCSSLQLGGTDSGSGDGFLGFANGSQLKVSGAVTLGVGNRKGNITMVLGGILSCEGFILNSHGVWQPGFGTIELTASNTLPNSDITSFHNLTISGGTTTLNSNIDISGNLEIQSGATLDGGASSLTLLGNWANEGTFNGNTGTVLFENNGNQNFTGTGSNNFNLLKVNMGILPSNTLEITASHFNAPDGFLTLSGGTLKLSGTFTLNNTLVTGPTYNIPPTSGLWINNPNVTVKAQAGGVSLRGILHITAGNMNIGTSTDHNLTYVEGASLIVDGGSLFIAGNLAGNNSASTLSYNQSGGEVTVTTEGSTDPNLGGFDLSVAGSSFIMTGGKLIIRNATSGPADYIVMAGNRTVTGGMIQAGDELSHTNQAIRIESIAVVYNLVVYPAVTAKISVLSLDVLNDLTVESTGTLDANGLNLTVGGNWTNAGEFIAGPLVTFAGLEAQTLTSSGKVEFNNLTIIKSGTAMTFNSDVAVTGAFTLSGTHLAIGEHVLTLSQTVTGNGTIAGVPGSTVKYLQGSDGQVILGGQYGNLEFNDFGKTLTPDRVFDMDGHFSPGLSPAHAAEGSVLVFSGADQNIPEFPYFSLSLGGTGVKHRQGSVTVKGDLLIQEGVEFNVDSSLVLEGVGNNMNHGTLHAREIDLQDGDTLSNFHSVTVDSILTGAGTLVQETGSELVLNGMMDITGFRASADGNTVDYSGIGAEVKPATYYNLMVSGSGTAAGDLTIGGSLSVEPGATFQAAGFTHSLAGDFMVDGTFDPDTGVIRFKGTTEQHMAGTTYAGLIIDNPVPVILAGDATVNRSLHILNGAIHTGDYQVILGPSGILNETPGHTVTGRITTTREIDAIQGTETFGNIGVEIVPGGTSPGSTTVSRTTGIASQGVDHSSILRYFDITPAINQGLAAGLVLHYDTSELAGQNEAAFEIYSSEDEGASWTNRGGTAHPSDHSISLTAVDQLSRWTISDTLHSLDDSGIPSSVDPASGNRLIFIYPLPASERLWFSETVRDVEILNVYGQVVIPRMKSVNSVSLEGLPNGTYFVRSEGRVMKFMKQ